MDRKVKLAFEQLERELSIVEPKKMVKIVGGFSSGMVVESFVDLSQLEDIAYLETVDDGESQDIDENSTFVEQNNFDMFINSYSTSGYDYGSGYDSSGTSGSGILIDPVEVVGSGNGGGDDWYYSGWDHASGSSSGSYYWSGNEGNTGGGGGGGNNNNQPPEDEEELDDPWKRDAQGNLVATKTNRESSLDYGDVTLLFDEYTLEMKDGSKVTVYKTKFVYDEVTQQYRDPLESEMSNCFGLAFADGDYWFWDDTTTAAKDEMAGFLSMRNMYYEECSFADASVAIVYSDASGMDPVHAGIVNADGTFTAKGGIGSESNFGTLSGFLNPTDNLSYSEGYVKYYRMK